MIVLVPGRLWRVGDNVDTDRLFPSKYVTLSGASKQATLEGLSTLDPELANIAEGDALVAGRNFGCGSSREYAVSALRDLGVRLVIARSYARIFYRNAMNLGLPALELADPEQLSDRGPLSANLRTGEITHLPTGQVAQASPIPDFLADMVSAGGLMAHLRATLHTAS